MLQEILLQAGYYAVAMSIGIFLLSIVLRGIMWPMVRVRLSFGKLILIKLRQVHRDYFKVGKIEDGFLVFGKGKEERRVAIHSNEYFYRLSGLMSIDVEDEKNALCKPDYSTVPGFDAVKYNNLYIRTLFGPAIADNQDKIIIGGLILVVVLVAIVGFLVYKNGYGIDFITQNIGQIASATKGVITG